MLTRSSDTVLRPALVFVLAGDRAVVEELTRRLGPADEIHALRDTEVFARHSAGLIPDLIIIDWSGLAYPDLDPVAKTTESPLIVLDRSPTIERHQQAREAGAFEYLPWDEKRLEDVRGAFERARQIPELKDELRQTEATYGAILDASNDGIFVLEDGVFSYVNDRLASVLGLEPAELVGQSALHELAPPEEHSVILEAVARAASSTSDGEVFTVTLTGNSGASRAFELFCRPAVLRDRAVVVGSARDVSAVRNLHQELDRHRARERHSGQLRALGEIAAGVAHDFNNVLEIILGRLDLIRIQAQKGRNIEPHIGIIEEAVHDAATIVGRIYEFTRPNAEPKWEDLDLAKLVQDSADFVRTRIQSPATLNVRVDGSEPYRGHRGELREVLVNLLNNACDAIADDGTVDIALFVRDGSPCITVADDGPGIPADVRDHIFEPFFTTKDRDGTGLGLSVSREILRRHDIDLSVETEEGHGTRFLLRFNSAVYTSSGDANHSNRVLVVDDDRAVGELVADVLTEAGYDVSIAPSSGAAAEAIASERYGVLLTDLDLDGESGWELARQARRTQPALTIGLMTGWPIGIEERDVRARGVDFVLTKPFSPQRLIQSIRLLK